MTPGRWMAIVKNLSGESRSAREGRLLTEEADTFGRGAPRRDSVLSKSGRCSIRRPA